MRVALARGLGHGRIAVVGQAGDDGLRLVDREMVFERLGVARVERDRAQVARTVSFHHGFGGRRIDVAQRDVIIAGLRQQAEMRAPILPAPRIRTLCMNTSFDGSVP